MNESPPGLGLDLATSDAANNVVAPYVVLARKYRPKDFSTLIGQDALVRTLTNAFAKGRLAHAYLLTGVRGVGKTTSARILAKAFNCVGPNGDRQEPTPEPCGQCANCLAITEDRHVDVLEIDAASNNGVDYIRELQGELHYKPVQARYRVYIVDEVHMLSTSAFNAFLKTLEEPPSHVKFIFATTEANKLPITIRSRCQRFDLRRVSAEQLKDYYARLAQMEQVAVDDEALALIAQAADGSVRDGLSMLDQAISLASADTGGNVSAQSVRDMLGLNDGGRLMSLFDLIHQGDAAKALAQFDQMFTDGADPSLLARELAQLTHLVTRRKIVGEQVASLKNDAEKNFLHAMAEGLSLGALNRSWELLIKGLDELRTHSHPQLSFEMLLVRLCHVAQMPDPDALLKQLQNNSGGTPSATPITGAGGEPLAPTGAQHQAAGASDDLPPLAARSEVETAAAPDNTKTETQTPPAAENHVTMAAPASTPAPSMYDHDDLDANFLSADLNQESRAKPGWQVNPEQAQLPVPQSFSELVAMLENTRQGLLSTHMSEDVRPVRLNGTSLRIRLTDRAPRDLARVLATTLQTLTGESWDVGLSDEDGDPPLGEQRRMARAEEYRAAHSHPAVAKALATFPEASIHDIRQKKPDSEAGPEPTIH